MRLFLQLDIGDWKQRNYSHLLVPYASSLAGDVIGTDIDNQSESTVIDLVVKLIEQAESVFIFISAKPDVTVGSADKMMRYLKQHQHKIHQLVMLGEHAAIETYARDLNGGFLEAKDSEEVKKRIQEFATKIPIPGRTSGLAP